MVFLGIGKFDVAFMLKYCICGGCRAKIDSVTNVGFINCLWSYRGTTQHDVHLESEVQHAKEDMVYMPMEHKTWNYLTVRAFEQQIQPTGRLYSDAAVQVNLEEEPLDLVIINALAQEANYYRERYVKLKESLREPITNNQPG